MSRAFIIIIISSAFIIGWVGTSLFLRRVKKCSLIISGSVGLLIGVFCFIAACLFVVSGEKPDPATAKIIAEEQHAADRMEKIKRQFSTWDGSHRSIEEYIKSVMNDPNSYEHVETRYVDFGEYLLVQTTFRGKNAYGGVVKNTVKAKVDLDGKVLDILATD